MTNDQFRKIQAITHADNNYQRDKESVRLLLAGYKQGSGEPGRLYDLITALADNMHWGRHKVYTLLQEIVMEMPVDKNYPEELYAVLTNYLDNLEGNIASEAIIKFETDPVTAQELIGYVRSLKWIEDQPSR